MPGLKRKNKSSTQAETDAIHDKAKKRKKSLLDKIDGPSEADKLLPRTMEERMNTKRVVVVLEKCALELVQPRKGAMELCNADDHKTMLGKSGRKIADMRPDITHQCLMALLDSPLNKAGKLCIYMHTAQNVLIEVHPSLRIPRTFKRFCGLMVELLQRNKIRAAGANEVLMKVISNPIEKYLPPGSRKVGLSVSGRSVKLRDFCKELHEGIHASEYKNDKDLPIVFAVGSVAHDDPITESRFGLDYVEDKISICDWGLSASCVCNKITSEFEYLWDVC